MIDGSSTTGTVNWTFNSGTETFDYLAVGESLVITYTVTIEDDNGASVTQDIVITVTGSNDAPTVTASMGDTQSLAETNAALTTSGSFDIEDVDTTDVVSIDSFSVATSGNDSDAAAPTSAELQAMFNALPAMSGPTSSPLIDGSSTTGTVNWTFNSGAETFDYLAVGESLVITYTVTIEDDNGASVTQDIVITVTGSNDAPTMTAGANTAYNYTGGAQVIDNTITVADADSTMLTGATVTISNNFDAADLLGFVNQNGISGVYNDATGVLTLSGNASVADYQAALQSVTFNTTGSPPATGDREFTFTTTDGTQTSTGVTSIITMPFYFTVPGNSGTAFNDFIDGTAGNDVINGSDGNDFILGLGGNDIINGGADNDVINGGAGADSLTGGAGADEFVFDGPVGGDIIQDFDVNEDFINIAELLDASFDPNMPSADITFSRIPSTTSNDLFMEVDTGSGIETITFGGSAPNLSDTINVVYDNSVSPIQVTVTA